LLSISTDSSSIILELRIWEVFRSWGLECVCAFHPWRCVDVLFAEVAVLQPSIWGGGIGCKTI
jgi:hypothetical protein